MFRNLAEFEALTGADAPTKAERRLISAMRAGELCVLCDPENPSLPSAATDATSIRAPLLRLLITGGTPECQLHETGVRLVGGWIAGALDLAYCAARGQTLLSFCHFDTKPNFCNAHLRQLGLSYSALPGLEAQGATVDASLFLRRTQSTGTVDVNGAKIGGQLACDNASFDGAGGSALNAQGIETGGSLLLPNLTATGTVHVSTAKIGGQLVCESATFDGAGGEALNAQGLETGRDLFLSNISTRGIVDLNYAKIGGQFAGVGATFDGAGGEALKAQGVETRQGFFLRNFTATGCVDVNGAKIGGQFACDSARFDGAGGKALNAQGLETRQGFFLHNLTAAGCVDVNGAKIGGQLDCSGASLDGAGGTALNAQGVKTRESLYLRRLTAKGTVELNSARIGGQLDCTGATFDGMGHKALNAQRVHVNQALIFRGLAGPPKGLVSFSAAYAGDLTDDDGSWPDGAGHLILEGFTYDRIQGGKNTNFAARRRWLEVGSVWQGEFLPQPYTQLARVLRQTGHSAEARKVLCERERLLARHRLAADRAAYKRALNGGPLEKGDAGWIWIRMTLSRLWSGIARYLAGYGYAPQWSFYWALGLFAFAAVLAQLAWWAGSFVPNSDVILTSPGWAGIVAHDCLPDPTPGCTANPAALWSDKATVSHDGAVLGVDWDSFNALAYAADLVVPILDLGQTEAWAPSKDRGFWGWVLWWGRWVLAGLGWLVSGLGIAAVTGVMQRNQPD